MKRVGEVAGGHAVAVGPCGGGAEVKRVGQAVGGDVPPLGDTGDGAAGFFVVAGQSLEEGDGDIHIGGGIDEGGVEGGGLVLVADEEGLRADALFDQGFAWGARCENKKGGEEAEHDAKTGLHGKGAKRWLVVEAKIFSQAGYNRWHAAV